MAVLVTGGAGYIGSAFVGQLLDAGEQVVVLDDLSRGHRAGRRSSGDASRRDGPATGALVTRLVREHGDRRLRALRRLRLRRRVRHRAGALLRQQLHPGGGALRVAGPGGGEARRLLLHLRHLRRPAARCRSPRATRSGRSTRTAGRSCSSSGCSPTSTARTACASWRCATSTPRAPRARCGEEHDPETHLVPLVLDAAAGRRDERDGLRQRLRHARRHRHPRLHPHRGPGRGAPARAPPPARRRRLAVPEPRQRTRLLGARGDRDGEARHRPRRALRDGPAPRGRPAAARRRRRAGARGARLGPEASRSSTASSARRGSGCRPTRRATEVSCSPTTSSI